MIPRRVFAMSVVAATLAVATPLVAQKSTTPPKNATAQCQDGTYSTAKTERGACSKHGGVKTWFGAPEKTDAKTTKKSPETGPKETPRAGAAGMSGSSASASPKVAAAVPPKNATAQCQDGSYSTAKTEGGACSKHGGVKTWFGNSDTAAKSGAGAAAAPATAGTAGSSSSASPKTTTAQPKQGTAPTGTAGAGVPENATARCKDGTYSFAKGHTGACSHHGGVAEWYKK